MYGCHGGSNQQWLLMPTGELKTQRDDRCLDYHYGNNNVYMHNCHGGSNQKWHVNPDGTMGTSYDGKCLDYHPTTKNVYMHNCHDGSNQKWVHPGFALDEYVQYLGHGSRSDIAWTECYSKNWGQCKVNEDFYTNREGSIDINGNIFTKGIVAHAHSYAKFNLGGSYTRFMACIGITKYNKDSRCGTTHGDASFRVVGDGSTKMDWLTKGPSQDATCISVDITGVNLLVLEANLGPAGRDCDLSTWADARVDSSNTPPSSYVVECDVDCTETCHEVDEMEVNERDRVLCTAKCATRSDSCTKCDGVAVTSSSKLLMLSAAGMMWPCYS